MCRTTSTFSTPLCQARAAGSVHRSPSWGVMRSGARFQTRDHQTAAETSKRTALDANPTRLNNRPQISASATAAAALVPQHYELAAIAATECSRGKSLAVRRRTPSPAWGAMRHGHFGSTVTSGDGCRSHRKDQSAAGASWRISSRVCPNRKSVAIRAAASWDRIPLAYAGAQTNKRCLESPSADATVCRT